jgi:hypothetical protein
MMVMVDEVCDTEEDILGLILDEVRGLKVAFEERIEKLEMGFIAMSSNVDFLVETYQGYNTRLTQQELAVQRGTPAPKASSTSLSVVPGGRREGGGDCDV